MANFIYIFRLYAFTFSKYLRSILHDLLKLSLSKYEFNSFHTKILYLVLLLPSLNQIQNLNNSLDHIYHLVSPFSLPTLFFDGFALYSDKVCQRIVARSARSSVVTGGFGARGIGNFSVVVAGCLVFEYSGH